MEKACRIFKKNPIRNFNLAKVSPTKANLFSVQQQIMADSSVEKQKQIKFCGGHNDRNVTYITNMMFALTNDAAGSVAFM